MVIQSMGEFKISKTMSYIRIIVINVVVLSLILFIIEGIASYVLMTHDVVTHHRLAEQRHTQYDPDLGWVNKPNIYIPDMYGPGVYLKTNSQRFRNNHDFETAVPKGKYRIICSGDSHTLGYGVDNDHTWCELLTSLDSRLETVNMGQGGYGIDQAYLWYKRDASRLEHQLYIMAFITDDFYRLQLDRFHGYGKPLIDTEKGKLVIKNVPVPRRPYYLPWFTSNFDRMMRLNTFKLLKQIYQNIGFEPVRSDTISERERNLKTQEVQRSIFKDLKHINDERSRKIILVYLPTIYEIKDNESQEWMRFIEKEAQTLGIPLINVLRIFRSLPYENVADMFIPEGQINYLNAGGHLNNRGNEFVARVIYEELKKSGSFQKLFNGSNQ